MKKSLMIIGICLLLGLSYIGLSFYGSANFIEVTSYQYDSDKIENEVKILALSDVHSHFFGKESSNLINKVESENPDIILLVGDVINYYAEDASFLYTLVKQLAPLAPVYYTLGNHEVSYQTRTKEVIREGVEKAGGVYLDQDYKDIEVNGEKIRIGGLYDYSFNNNNVPLEQYHQKGSYVFLKEYEETNEFKLMMAHRPESFITNDEDAKWDIDLVISGHEHGGQIRVPILGGFYSTHLGLFSKFLDGYHLSNGVPILVSRGLSTHQHRVPPRFYNIPEIVIIDLK